ncbi:MAG: hypothetical protein KGJ79_03125 [Alphaproteobacteria bacterium]|nr:hypothetical protein [Alphaproteobacteria bacterium]MDE2110109.1 hypothetical protein [Alphaproteobacteria bacterium]MDE2495135.1 hypothetical protein [Alphaproteobacteria bacterium]
MPLTALGVENANLDDKSAAFTVTWKQVGLDGTRAAEELWTGAAVLPASDRISVVAVSAHGAAIYRVE